MVKKKARNIPAPEPADTEPTCKHIRKGLEEGVVKKALVNVDWTLCQDCQAESKEKTNNEEEEQAEEQAEAQVIWLCLKCGHRGCGRYSERQHALNHYNTPRSEPHCLVLSVGDWNVWCYLCDGEVQHSNSGRLRQLVDFIQKKSQTNVKISNTVQSGQENLRSENNEEKEEHEVLDDPNKGVKGAKGSQVSTLNDSKEVTVKGLSNLGNTCFFNAVMQNLSQTPTLREMLNEVKHPGRAVTVQVPDDSQPTPREVTLEQQPGPLTLAMWQFITEMQETKKGVVTPKELFSQVCKKAIRFKGYQQQDSQELLRYLLDGMRGEEIQRVSSAISKMLQATSEKTEDDQIKKIVKDCEKRRAIPNFVDRLFGGELTSTIMCETCHTVSLVHEPFLDLSLPVLDDAPAKKNTAKSAKADEKKEEEESDNDSYVKERNDLPSGPSKHLQKKAKKQAKKQAKNQRRQQKIQDKTLLLNDSNASHNDDEDSIPDNNNVLDNNGEQEKTAANGPSSSITSDVDMEKIEDREHLENEEPSETNMENNSDAGSRSLDSQHSSAMEDQESSHDLNPTSIHKTEPSLESEDEPSNEVTVVLENGDLNQDNIDSDDVQEKRSPSPQVEHDLVDSQLTENLNRLNLSSDVERLNLSSDLEPSDIEIQIIDEAPTAQVYEVVNEDPKTAFCTLADRKELQPAEWSVLSCLYQFTRKEDLMGSNQLLCNTCTQRQAKTMKNKNKEKKFVYTNAKKQMLVSAPPPILTLHLKRFQQNGFNLHKINKHIKFPEVIDLAPFSTVKCKKIPEGEDRLLYSLYGVIEHSGTMRSGHYTAYVKSRTPNPHLCDLVLRGVLPEVLSTEPTKGHWFHISDSHVQAVPLSKVLNSQAYLLFYERIL